MAESALHYKYYYTAYGLFNKHLSETHEDGKDKNREIAQNGLLSISQSVHIDPSISDFIMENLDRDLFELIWILDDLDQNSQQYNLLIADRQKDTHNQPYLIDFSITIWESIANPAFVPSFVFCYYILS